MFTRSFKATSLGKESLKFFELIRHPEAKDVYAWIYSEGNQDHTVIVLEKPPVDSPQSAVKVAIASKARQQ